MQSRKLAECLDWLATKPWFYQDACGVKRVKQAIAQLGLKKFSQPVVTVGGTNGKGTTVALLEQIYQKQAYTTASFTSPHVVRFNERIKLNGIPIDDDSLAEAFVRIRSEIRFPLRRFDYLFLAALILFEQQATDIILLEVGLGGRDDATNAIDADVAIITSVDLDHIDCLGKTRAAIATHKSGIFRENQTIICGDSSPPNTLIEQAYAKTEAVYRIGVDFGIKAQTDTQARFYNLQAIDLTVPLPIPVVQSNLACALQASLMLKNRLPIDETALSKGLTSFKQIGRQQVILRDKQCFLLDGAHNPAAVECLAQLLCRQFQDKRILALFGMHSDKDIKACIQPIKPWVKRWFVAPLHTTKAADEVQLKAAFSYYPELQVRFFKSVSCALKAIDKVYDLILVFGSFELVGQISALLNLD